MHFDKPNDQNQACLSFGVTRKKPCTMEPRDNSYISLGKTDNRLFYFSIQSVCFTFLISFILFF